MKRPLDLSLYLVIGSDVTGGRSVVDVVRQAVDGGVRAVQLREKHAGLRAFVAEAQALVTLLRPLGIPLIINDRLDIALAADADGVHVGQNDMAVSDVRRLTGAEWIVGLSVSSVAEALAVDTHVVDYVGVGPVFATATKADAALPLGLEGTATIRQMLRLPVVAIGGINASNAAQVLATGVDGIAVVSAICSASKPRDAAAVLAAMHQSAERA